MKHFISFQKLKGLYVPTADSNFSSEKLAHQINNELLVYGYYLSKDLFDRLSLKSESYLTELYTDLIGNIIKVSGNDQAKPIYKNFPETVFNTVYSNNSLGIVMNLWAGNQVNVIDSDVFEKEYALEVASLKEITAITENEYNDIFTNILYSNKSISSFDKTILEYFINSGVMFNFGKIKFKEIIAFVGKFLLESNVTKLPTKDATNVLRIYSAFSGGDEGLKENTKFKVPTARQRRVLLSTLDDCYNLEEAFKINQEKWKRLLFYLNPMTQENFYKYPNVNKYAYLVRNEAKKLKTFNSIVEGLISKRDASVLDVLQKNSGAFMRRLDHMVVLFGFDALKKWLATNPSILNLVTTYNFFTDRDQTQAGRGAILAGQGQSSVVTYGAKDALDSALVSRIKLALLDKIKTVKSADLAGKKVYIDRALYYTPMSMNNRASSLSLDGKPNGTVEQVGKDVKTIRMYIQWDQRNDIDLSGMLINKDGSVIKVGWNGSHNYNNGSVIYSGDNTGQYDKNAEYIDINLQKLPSDVEWIVNDARIYSGPRSFSGYNGGVRAGWMERDKPEANRDWVPKTVTHAQVLNNTSNNAYLMAYHVETRSVVYLDLAIGNNHVSTGADAVKMITFLNTFVTLDDGAPEIKWDKFNQGHILNVLAEDVVSEEKDADIVFSSDKTTWEMVAKYM